MDNKLKELIQKLTLLGNQMKIINNNTLIVYNANTNSVRIMSIVGGIQLMSTEFDEIIHLVGSNSYLAIKNKAYYIVQCDKKISIGPPYKELGKYVMSSTGKYNIVAKLNNGLTGVIDENGSLIIPFIHSQINVVRVENKFIYFGEIIETKRVYYDNGVLCKVSDSIRDRSIIICDDYIIMFDSRDRYGFGMYTLIRLDGTIILQADMVNIINNGDSCRIVGKQGNIILNNIKISKFIL